METAGVGFMKRLNRLVSCFHIEVLECTSLYSFLLKYFDSGSCERVS
jgi:hypothetical protein